MEYYNDILCISHAELTAGLMTYDQVRNYLRRDKLNQVRRGCRETPALYSIESLPAKFRVEVYKKYKKPKGEEKQAASDLLSLVRADAAAVSFFKDYRFTDGREIEPPMQAKYANNAAILNAIYEYMQRHHTARAKQGKNPLPKRVLFERFCKALPNIHESGWQHNLPEYPRNLEAKYKQYMDTDYESIVKQTCADYKHAQIVTPQIERMIVSIYAMKNKPFAKSVAEIYAMFLRGEIEIFDRDTGELYDRSAFCDKNGMLITLSESTVWNWLNKPKNRRIADAIRNDMKYNRRVNVPYEQRESPEYSLSKISMDDRELTRKTTEGKKVSAYYAYDVASGCCIGAAYSLAKDTPLVYACLLDLYKFLARNGLGNPLECEVEHHLTGNIIDVLQEMFSHIRLCNPANSQEKRAEHGNRAKKYGAEKALGQPTGRHHSKHEAYLQPQKLGKDNVIIEKQLPFDRLVAEDREAIAMHNNELHPNQDDYKGMTRMEVLLKSQNPNLPAIDNRTWIKHVGQSTKTSVRNTKYCRIQYADYCLPTPEVIDKFKPGNYSGVAYYLPNDNGVIDSVYLYQDGKFIAECAKVVKYQEAKAERTAADEAAMVEQHKYNSQYYKMVREGKEQKIARVEIIKKTLVKEIEQIDNVETAPLPRDEIDEIVAAVYSNDFYSEKSVEQQAIETF